MRRFPSLLALLAALAVLGTACDQYAVAADPPATPELTPVPTAAPVTCALGGVDPPAAAERIRDRFGGCLLAGQALLVRCDPADPPAIALDASGQERRFLGGAFAVPLAEAPIGLEEVGRMTAGRLWRSANDPRRVFLESGGGFERWLALPLEGSLGPAATATMIGDSILDGAAEAVMAALVDWEVVIDAEVGRGSYTAASLAEGLEPPLPDVLVIEIGTNDHDPVGFTENADRVLTAARDAGLVVWVTTHTPDGDSDVVNQAMREVVARSPQAALADWDAFVPPDALNGDGVHLDAGSEHLLADLLTPMLESWRLAVGGAGPTSCLGPILTAND